MASINGRKVGVEKRKQCLSARSHHRHACAFNLRRTKGPDQVLRNVRLFIGVSPSAFPLGFIGLIGCRYFLKGDYLEKEGDVCRELTFISTGYVEALSKDKVHT